jgi:hypothetical protein
MFVHRPLRRVCRAQSRRTNRLLSYLADRSTDEYITHFTLWAMAKSPLILGNDLTIMVRPSRPRFEILSRRTDPFPFPSSLAGRDHQGHHRQQGHHRRQPASGRSGPTCATSQRDAGRAAVVEGRSRARVGSRSAASLSSLSGSLSLTCDIGVALQSLRCRSYQLDGRGRHDGRVAQGGLQRRREFFGDISSLLQNVDRALLFYVYRRPLSGPPTLPPRTFGLVSSRSSLSSLLTSH